MSALYGPMARIVAVLVHQMKTLKQERKTYLLAMEVDHQK
jgi:hypothetical protein